MIVDLDHDAACDRDRVGGKAATLAQLRAREFPVPAGLVVPVESNPSPSELAGALAQLGADRFAVRSSALAEDLADASYAGLYETFLQVASEDVPTAIRRCREAATADRVAAYHGHRQRSTAVAVLVQPMVDAQAAGVAFTANPVTGARTDTIVTAVAGLGEELVSGRATGEEWTIRGDHPTATRPADVLTPEQAVAVADLANRVQATFNGAPQDIEWAISDGTAYLLQARPMTALPDPVCWDPPGPGLWVRNFRLGEWLPDPVTPLFVDWLLLRLEEGFADGMTETAGAAVTFGSQVVNGWYYTRPNPPPAALPSALLRSRGRLLRFMVNALIRPSRNPAAADQALLDRLHRRWRDELLPAYRELAFENLASETIAPADTTELVEMIDRIGRIAGRHLWYLAVVGGSAWKMERCLARFLSHHRITEIDPRSLLVGLPETNLDAAAHAVYSIDWYHPTVAEARPHPADIPGPAGRSQLQDARLEAEDQCRDRLKDRPPTLAAFNRILSTAQKYAGIREHQARELTLGWPRLRHCVHQLAQRLLDEGGLDATDEIYFLRRHELLTPGPHASIARERRHTWERQRHLDAPLAIGKAPVLGGAHLQTTLGLRMHPDPGALLTGQPASAGRATGTARIIHGPEDFDRVRPGDVLIARITTPAWTPLFSRVAAVVTDGGTLAAHASLIAREYAIPAVVGTRSATTTLHDGQGITVDGNTGAVNAAATAD